MWLSALFLLSLAYLLVLNFLTYADDLKFSRRTLLISLTWQRAIPIHNILIISAYLFLALIPFFGIPIRLLWPAFVTLPLALFQIILMNNISQGDKPNWSILKYSAMASYGLTLYFIVLIFILH